MVRRDFAVKAIKALVYAVSAMALGILIEAKNTRGESFAANCPRDYYCLSRCPFDAIGTDSGGYPLIERKKCVAWVAEVAQFRWRKCGLCLKGCPTKALELLNKAEELSKYTK